MDHAKFGNHTLLVTIDAYSKWPEVHIVPSTSAQPTIDKLRTIFATHGLPMTLVSDNGSPFQSTEFHNFMTSNAIVHCHVPPYHPSSNGLAENMVKTVKQALSKCKVTPLRLTLLVFYPRTKILATVPLQGHLQSYFSIEHL